MNIRFLQLTIVLLAIGMPLSSLGMDMDPPPIVAPPVPQMVKSTDKYTLNIPIDTIPPLEQIDVYDENAIGPNTLEADNSYVLAEGTNQFLDYDMNLIACGTGCYERRYSDVPYNIVPIHDESGLFPAYMKRFGRQMYIDAWVQAGITNAPSWPEKKTGNPILYTDRVNEPIMNQLYFTLGREVDRNNCSFDIGGRIDLLYGTDYLWTSALGLETHRKDGNGNLVTDPREADQKWNSNSNKFRGQRQNAALYGLSMPQAYFELFVPISYGLSIKGGHFYSPLSYESAMAPENFFYSHSYTFMYGEPTTLSGLLFTQNLTGRFSLNFGITGGWDQWENPNHRISYLAGFHWNSCDKKTALDFNIQTGRAGMNPGTRTNYSMIFSHKINPKLRYALQHNMGIWEDGAIESVNFDNGITKLTDSKWVSITQYLYFDYSKTLSFGLRAEWFQDNKNARILDMPGVSYFNGDGDIIAEGKNYYTIALGANWKPAEYITLRPEIRYDWSDVKLHARDMSYMTRSYNGGKDKEYLTLGLDAIIRF